MQEGLSQAKSEKINVCFEFNKPEQIGKRVDK